MTSKSELCRKLIEARSKANRDYDTEDFNGSLLIDGVTGHFGFEMHKCDRDFIAFSAKHASDIAKWALELEDKNKKLREALAQYRSIFQQLSS